jgi:hypothetical protein
MGFPVFAGHAVRVDMVEKVLTAGEGFTDANLAGWLGLPTRAALKVIAAIRG